MKTLKILLISGTMLLSGSVLLAQKQPVSPKDMTREQIVSLSLDELLEMSMEDLLVLSQKLGVSIDELLKMKTSVASRSELTPRETPGIISIVTLEEIQTSGARDLIDVLRLVPGFDFGYDVQGVISVGLRGNWVHEGKILLLIDGQEINELGYNNLALGNHVPVDQILRIEIIRGPGSAIYGGNAELGVINIVTKTGEKLKGAQLALTYGQLQNSMGRANMNLNTGTKIGEWDISAKGFLGWANRSDQLYFNTFDESNDTTDFSEEGSAIRTTHVNLGANNDKLYLRLIYDDYKTEYVYYDDEELENFTIFNEFRTILGEAKYNLEVSEKLSIVPRFQYKFSRPFYEEEYWRNFYVNRYTGKVSLNYAPVKSISIAAGVEAMNDRGKCIEENGIFYMTGERTFSLLNIAGYTEGIFKWKNLNFIAGGRVEENSRYGWAAAPRAGITGILNKFHFKGLVSGAFRTPSIGNIDAADDIVPEKALISELELGYRLNNHMFVTANLFDIIINKSIIYFDYGGWEEGVDWGYMNADRAGSDGVEIEFKTKYSRFFAVASYSYHTFKFKIFPDLYAVPEQNDRALAFSPHKLVFYGAYTPVKKLSLSPSIIYCSRRYGYTSLDNDGETPIAEAFDAYVLANFSVVYTNLFIKGLDASLSVFDILNSRPPILQPYDGWHPPYPARSREIILKFSLSI